MEPERDIEKTLRTYAKMRRDEGGVPPELHPATRKLLQAEVAARRGRGHLNATTWSGMLWGTWPRLAFTLCSATAVVLAAGFLLIPALRNNPENLMARTDKNTGAPTAFNEPVAAPAERQSETAKEKDAPAFASRDLQKAAAPSLAQAAASSALKAELPAPPLGSSTQPVLPNTLSIGGTQLDFESAALGGQLQNGATNVVTQKYARASAPATAGTLADASATPAVLDNFRVEQTGNQLRVIDGDGSIYTGSLLARSEDTAAQSTAVAKSLPIGGGGGAGFAGGAAEQDRSQVQAPEFAFRVTGTNVSLNQLVVFSGNFVKNDTPQPTGGRRAGSGGGGGGRAGARVATARSTATDALASNVAAPAAATNSIQAPNMRLRGEVLIGTNRTELDALPVKQ